MKCFLLFRFEEAVAAEKVSLVALAVVMMMLLLVELALLIRQEKENSSKVKAIARIQINNKRKQNFMKGHKCIFLHLFGLRDFVRSFQYCTNIDVVDLYYTRVQEPRIAARQIFLCKLCCDGKFYQTIFGLKAPVV